MKSTCHDINYKKDPFYKSIFWNSSMSPEGLDKKIAKEAGLKAGEIYSAEYPVACGGMKLWQNY